MYKWIEKIDHIACVNTSDIDIDLIRGYMDKINNKYDRSIIEKEFKEMYVFIKNWLEG